MDHTSGLALEIAQLEAALAAADPAAVLAPPRILRRVIKQDRRIKGLGLKVPHRKSYLLDARALAEIVDWDELGLDPWQPPQGTVLLLARPDPDKLLAMTAGEALLKYWRLLFHARVHLALDQRAASGLLDETAVRERIRRIGQSQFDEARAVLRQENYLLPPPSDVAAYIEFAAVYCELRFFAPSLLPHYFSTIGDASRVEQVLAEDFDASELLAATRLAGAPAPIEPPVEVVEEPLEEFDTDDLALAPRKASDRLYRALCRRAERAAAAGNAVRAAIFRTRAARHVRPSLAARTRDEARDHLHDLTRRLQAALGFTDKDARRWTRLLGALLRRSLRGFWTRESRILYDLQKVCVDYERDIYTLDLVEWGLSRGRLPIKRQLPGQREVLMCKHLRTAAGRATAVRLPEAERIRLAALLHAAVARAEHALRERFSPLIDDALAHVGLRPQNLPEEVALRKLVEELLDRTVDRGFLTMGDLRDAISRNNLKLPDLDGGKEFLLGDRLLRADRRLATTLDGVYHRGEVYLRWPQRLSSLAFGTHPGRLLVRYAAIPFGGAYVVLEGLKHLVNGVLEYGAGSDVKVLDSGLALLLGTLLVGGLLLGLIHVESFRRGCLEAVRGVYRLGRALLVDWLAWLLRQPLVRRVLESTYFRLASRYLFKPLVFTTLVLLVFPGLIHSPGHGTASGAIVFLVVNLVLNSRLGRIAEEVVTDWIVRAWDHFRIRIVAAVIHSIMDFFNQVVDTLDRFLYSVDEWLRFRSGQGRLAVSAKAVFGLIWFFVTYFLRFCINLLIEPQINPVKHFPVVTVSHKVLISLTPAILPVFVAATAPLTGEIMAKTIYWNVIFVIPGVFGFLVWELKENWRLYDANRPRLLGTAPVGKHGETVVRLLRPGFHSGTVPKLYARLRRAHRKAHWSGNWRFVRKYRSAIQQVELAVRSFLERELLNLLEQSHRFKPVALELGQARLGSNSIRFQLRLRDSSRQPLEIAIDERAGWLVARVVDPGWLDQLQGEQSQALADALTGLYQMAGISLVREQIEAALEPGAAWDVVEEGLLICAGRVDTEGWLYDLRGTQPDGAGPAPPPPPGNAPDRERVVFASAPVPWELWVEVWQRDRAGDKFPPRLVLGSRLVPEAVHGSQLPPVNVPDTRQLATDN